MQTPALSVVVVVYDMAREAPRTLHSLSSAYQQHIDPATYEVIVVDNGSPEPLDEAMFASLSGSFRLFRLDPAPPSPAFALNVGLRAARGDVVAVMIDGARLATPGLFHYGLAATRLFERSIVASLGWYLGFDFQGFAQRAGYDARREDELLASIGWPADGYRLFEIGAMDESSADGWFQMVSESNAVFARRELWELIGGFDEAFDEPGGGLLNLDAWNRLLEIERSKLVVLLGEGTFHQIHGGVSTNADPERKAGLFARWSEQYESIRGRPWAPPNARPATYLGELPAAALRRFVRAATDPARYHFARPIGDAFVVEHWSDGTIPSEHPTAQSLVRLGRERFAEHDFEGAAAVARVLRERYPEHALDAMLSVVAPRAGEGGPAFARRSAFHVATGEALEIVGDPVAAERHYREALEADPTHARAHGGLARVRLPGPDYRWWLAQLYERLAPRFVLEIGVGDGFSIALVRPPAVAIGVDPQARATVPLVAETHLFPETSDAFFARDGAAPILAGEPVSIAFVDGRHTFEQALRDFIAIERLCGGGSTILMHDTVPLDEPTEWDGRASGFWTGDVWKIVPCLRELRPELQVFTIATQPAGLTVVRNLDPESGVLAERFDEALERFGSLPYASERDVRAMGDVVANDWDTVFSRFERAGLTLVP